MFSKDDEKYLIRLLGKNDVVLFLGSGFSLGAKNRLDEHFPTGAKLCEKIWEFLGYNGNYDNTPLPEMYHAFMTKGIKEYAKVEFLEQNLLCSEIPENYDSIAYPYWYKIYTLNVDDVLDQVFERNSRLTQNLIYPFDEYKERDQSLEKTHIVYLHGMLPCKPDQVLFSTKQYARSHLNYQPLYGQFVYDYAIKPTVFLGTDLNEPIFERYIEAREGREGYNELRPKSFLITPKISNVKSDILKGQYNVHHIEGTIDEFLDWLSSKLEKLPSKEEILRDTYPNFLNVLSFADISNVPRSSINFFAKSFNRVPKEFHIKEDRSAYLLGASPRWNDIFKQLDIPRNITRDIFIEIENRYSDSKKNQKLHVIGIVGSAGSGKSTILKRLGLQLSQNGRTTFLSYSEFIPASEYIIDVLKAIKERVIILFDNSKNLIPQFVSLANSLASLKFQPIIVLSIRSNHITRLNSVLDPDLVNYAEFLIPDLEDEEINNLITTLDEHNLLGVLKGQSAQQRFRAFKYKARKQILVAMKEATEGLNFNEIIKNEFSEIEPAEAKLLCLCVALNTELGFTNSKQDFVGFSNVSHNEALNYLGSVLRGTLLWVGTGDKFMIRHKILADFMLRQCADLKMVKEAYVRVLSILAPELKNVHGPSRKFNLYKSLINHRILYHRFKKNIELARNVYESITDFFGDDYHFWLQYGSLEVEGERGDLELAQIYLNQANSIRPENSYIESAQCNLYYKQSYAHPDFAAAVDFKQKADDLASRLLLKIGKDDPHIYHINCRGTYYFAKKWVHDREVKKTMLEEIKSRISAGIRFHPRDKKLEVISQTIHRAYLQIGIKDPDITDPDIPT